MGLPPGLSIVVLSGDRSLQMYDDPDMEERGEVHDEMLSSNRSLQMSDDPDTEERDEVHSVTKYIEAITAAKFEIRVTLDSTFDWYGCTAVRVVAVYDGDEPGWCKDIREELDYSHTRHRVRFATVPKWCESSQQWQSGSLSFGSLETKEAADFRADPKSLSSLGSIKITAQRVVYTSPMPTQDYAGKGLQRISEVSEKMLKGKAITNSIECIDPRPVAKPINSVPVVPILGPLGEKYTVNILYRSKRVLQMIGCIPRTPSPDLEEDDIIITRNEAGSTDRKTEIQGLRARLALLEHDPNLKSETSNATRVKREREEIEVVSARKRSRRSDGIETVDLTGD